MADQGMDARGLAGDPQMGDVYDSTVAYTALPKNTTQFQKVDPAGAGIANGEGRIPTYSAASITYTPFAPSTDIAVITGSATKLVRIKRVGVSGRATAANQLDVGLYKRTTVDASGSPTALTAQMHDTTANPAATAVVQTFGAAPTITGTGSVLFRCQQSNVSQSGAGGAATPIEWHFGDVNDQSMVLHGTGEQICINLASASMAGLVLNLFLEWSEE